LELPKPQKDIFQIPENKVSFFISTKWQFYLDFLQGLKYTTLFKNLSKDLLSLSHAECKLEQFK